MGQQNSCNTLSGVQLASSPATPSFSMMHAENGRAWEAKSHAANYIMALYSKVYIV